MPTGISVCKAHCFGAPHNSFLSDCLAFDVCYGPAFSCSAHHSISAVTSDTCSRNPTMLILNDRLSFPAVFLHRQI